MKFSIVIQSSPFSAQSTSTALNFARAVIEEGHELYRVFFYGDSVLVANTLISPPQDEQNLPQEWRALAKEHNTDLVVCIAAAVKRGVLDDKEAIRYEKDHGNLNPGFELSGLGQLAEAIVISDRLVTFGA